MSTDTSPDEQAPKPGDSYVQSFARGLAVLRSFGADAPAQTLSEVAQRTGLTRAGARRILLTLVHLGYMEAAGRQFRLTPKVLDLGYAYLSSLPVWSQAQPILEELTAELRQSCSATVLDGGDIVYVLRLATHVDDVAAIEHGGRAGLAQLGGQLFEDRLGLAPDGQRRQVGVAEVEHLGRQAELASGAFHVA